MGDGNPLATFGHVVRELDRRQVGYLTMLEPNAKDLAKGVAIAEVAGTFRPMTTVPFVVNTWFDKARGMQALARGDADAVAYGVRFLASPDLVARFAADAELNQPDPMTLYGRGSEGYTDYPRLRAPRELAPNEP